MERDKVEHMNTRENQTTGHLPTELLASQDSVRMLVEFNSGFDIAYPMSGTQLANHR